MHKKDEVSSYISLDKSFIRLLISQGIMEFGDNFRLMATTIVLLNITGSGLAAGFSLVMTPIVGIALSPLAGVLGDGLDGRKFLSALYLLQGALAIFLINSAQLNVIYMILILFAGIQIIQDPVYKKMIRDSLQKSYIVVGNSLSTGMSGFSNLVGPILAGIGIQMRGTNTVLVVSSLAYMVSSLLVLTGTSKNITNTDRDFKELTVGRKSKSIFNKFSRQMKEGMKYFWGNYPIREIGFATFIFFFGATSVSFAFYSFAFDVLGITVGGWGFILSVFYSTRLLAMFISILINGGKSKLSMGNIFLPLLFTCLSWLLYGLANEFAYVLPILIMEGTSHFLVEIFLWTGIHIESNKAVVARIVGINNIVSNMARIIGIVLAYIIIQIYSVQAVFIFNGIFIFIYAIYKIVF